MIQQLQINLPEATLKQIDQAISITDSLDEQQQKRNELIDKAIKFFLAEQENQSLRDRIQEGAIKHYQRDLNTVNEWFYLEEEVW